MSRRLKQTSRVLAGLTAIALLADPVLTVVHLLEHEHQHSWCEAHQHFVHLDPEGEPVGSPEVSEDAVWDASGHWSHHHEECAALTALRLETSRTLGDQHPPPSSHQA